MLVRGHWDVVGMRGKQQQQQQQQEETIRSKHSELLQKKHSNPQKESHYQQEIKPCPSRESFVSRDGGHLRVSSSLVKGGLGMACEDVYQGGPKTGYK